MKQRIMRIVACLCLAALLLAGCSKKENGVGQMGSEVWEEMPKLTYGVLETDPLEVLSWDSGRCEATSRNRRAETENGYYLDNTYLYYADKKDLGNWLPVCGKPNCSHDSNPSQQNEDCDAFMGNGDIIVKSDRIYFMSDALFGYHRHLCPYEGTGRMILSMAPDGTDKKFCYAIKEDPAATGGMYTGCLTDKNWVYYREYLDRDGNAVRHLYLTNEEGTKDILVESELDIRDGWFTTFANGDEAYHSNVLGTAEYGVYRFTNGEIEELECAGLEVDGAYLSGNTLRIFRPNDGYYDVDLTTREEVFLAPAQLENSSASIELPNCIIESTLFDSSGWSKDVSHQMVIFDGETWREVELPTELAYSGSNYRWPDFWVASDSIFVNIYSKMSGKEHIYRIPLTMGELKAEFCCEIG